MRLQQKGFGVKGAVLEVKGLGQGKGFRVWGVLKCATATMQPLSRLSPNFLVREHGNVIPV